MNDAIEKCDTLTNAYLKHRLDWTNREINQSNESIYMKRKILKSVQRDIEIDSTKIDVVNQSGSA